MQTRVWGGLLFALLWAGTGCRNCGGEDSLQQTIQLLTPSSDDVDFGDVLVGVPRVRTLTLRSSGTGAVHVTRINTEGDASFSVTPHDARLLDTGDSYPLLIAVNAAGEGELSGSVVVENDSQNAPHLVVQLHAHASGQPDCDDQNACTDDAFDPVLGICLHANNAAPCDSGSKCTHEDRCVNGQCLGLATTCDDHNVCTRDLCDPSIGCVFLPDPAVCEDFNTCTVDTCDAARGCTHHSLPDGALCEDGNLCTLGDQCYAGTCQGTHTTQDPAPVGVAYSYGTNGTLVVLPDERIVFFDSLDRAEGPFLRVSVVERVAGRLQHLKSTDFLQVSRATAPRVLANGTVAAVTPVGAGAAQVRVFSLDTDGTAHDVATAPSANGLLDKPAVFGNFYYGVEQTGANSTGYAVDVTNPAQPAQHAFVLPPHTYVLAVDPVQQVLLAGTETGIARLSLAVPQVPVMTDMLMMPNVIALACDGVVTAVAFGLSNPQVNLLDAVTGTVLGSLATDGMSGVYSLAVQQGSLVAAWNDGALRAYNLHDTGTVMPLTELRLAPFDGGYLSPGNSPTRMVGMGSEVVVLEGVPLTLHDVTGPGHGRLGTLFDEGETLVVTSAQGAHRLNVTTPAAPFFVDGTRFPVRVGLVSLTSQLRTPTLFAEVELGSRSFDPLVLDLANTEGTPWMDASDLSAPVVAGVSRFPNVIGVHRYARSDGRRMYMTTSGTAVGDFIRFQILNPDNAQGTGTLTVPSVSSLDIPSTLGNHYPSAGYIAKDGATHQVVISAQAGVSGEGPSQLVVLNVSNPAMPTVVTSLELPYGVDGVAIHGSVIAVVEMAHSTVHILSFDAAQPGQFSSLAALSVAGISHLLIMDEHVLLMATHSGVAYANLVANPPVLLGQVSTPEVRPLSAALHGTTLLLSMPGEVLALSPPCPPPTLP